MRKCKGVDLRKAAAFHEAGHAAVGYWFGWYLQDRGVEIDEQQYCASRSQGRFYTTEARIIQAMAGWSAERKWHGLGPRSNPTKSELPYILKKLRHDDDEFDGDDFVEILQAILKEMPEATDEDIWRALSRYRTATERLLARPNVWRCVRKLAHALIAKGRLSNNEAIDALGRDFGCIYHGAYR